MARLNLRDNTILIQCTAFNGAEERWGERRARGLDDDELREAIKYEFGHWGGGLSNSWRLSYEVCGDGDPRLFMGERPRKGQKDLREKLRGKRLLDEVRRVLEIPQRGTRQLRLL